MVSVPVSCGECYHEVELRHHRREPATAAEAGERYRLVQAAHLIHRYRLGVGRRPETVAELEDWLAAQDRGGGER